jgi:hypothetical protein
MARLLTRAHMCATLPAVSAPTPKRRGRPPANADNPTSRSAHHLGLRLADDRWEKLLAIVEAANERVRGVGAPATVTASSLVTLWICERIDEEAAKLGKKR